MTEILLPRIARQGTVSLISTTRQARKARIEELELDEGFQPYHPPPADTPLWQTGTGTHASNTKQAGRHNLRLLILPLTLPSLALGGATCLTLLA